MALSWPSILKPTGGHDPELRNFTKGGPPTRSGRRQRVYIDAGFWEYTPEIPIWTEEQVREWRALRAKLRVGDDVDVKIFERNGPPGFYSGNASAVTVGDLDVGATTMDLTVIGVKLMKGTYFNIGNRLHLIGGVVTGAGIPTNPFSTPGSKWDDSRSGYSSTPGTTQATQIEFLPPLRTDYDSGTALSFTSLTFRAVLAEPSSGDTPLARGRTGIATPTFREVI